MKKLFLYFAILSFIFTSCGNEKFFTPEELEFLSVFEIGETFELVNDSNETINIKVVDKTITEDKWNCAECFGPTTYEVLTYHFKIEDNSKLYDGTMVSESLDDPSYIEYNFERESFYNIKGVTDFWCNDTLTIDSITYVDVGIGDRYDYFNNGLNNGYITIGGF